MYLNGSKRRLLANLSRAQFLALRPIIARRCAQSGGGTEWPPPAAYFAQSAPAGSDRRAFQRYINVTKPVLVCAVLGSWRVMICWRRPSGKTPPVGDQDSAASREFSDTGVHQVHAVAEYGRHFSDTKAWNSAVPGRQNQPFMGAPMRGGSTRHAPMLKCSTWNIVPDREHRRTNRFI
jgi:hypothetical protein